jgi:hypothetical protein
MRSFMSSMLSKTTARPVCLKRCGLAAEGLMTQPPGARLPRSTAMPACGLTGAAKGAMTSRL